jgi:hypothetical protein
MNVIQNSVSPQATADEPGDLPACLLRDNLTSPYFPNTSLAVLTAISALCAVFALTSIQRLNHTDLWGHVNFGRWMAEHHALPAVDPFAASPSEAPILHAAWLAQLAAYETQHWFGNEGLVFGHALLVTLTAGVLMLAVVRRGTPPVWSWTAGMAMFVLALPIVGTIRPQLFGQLAAALCLLACAELPQRRHPLVWLPLVAAAWANLHGSVLIGVGILGIHAVGSSWVLWQTSTGGFSSLLRDRRLHVVWAAPLLVALAACLNPQGPLLLIHTATFSEHAALAAISEWRALSPASLTGILMITSVGLTVLLAKYSPRKWEPHEVLLLCVFGLATLPAIRMLAWWAVVWPWVCVPHAAAAFRLVFSSRHTPGAAEPERHMEGAGYPDEPTAMRTVLAMGVVFLVIVVSPPTFSLLAGRSRGEGLVLSRETPIYVAEEAVRRNLGGTIAAPLDWADYLVWKTDGKLRPLVYSHVHLAEPEAWQAYQTIFRGDEAWLEALRANDIHYVLVSRSRSPQLAKQVLYNDRSGKGDVRIVYQDLRCILAEIVR